MNVAPHINPHNLSQNPIFPQKVSQLLCPSGWYKRTVHWSSHYFSKFKHRHRQHGFSLQKELITWHVCYRQFALCLSVSLSYVQISDVRIRIQIFLGWIWIRMREKKGGFGFESGFEISVYTDSPCCLLGPSMNSLIRIRIRIQSSWIRIRIQIQEKRGGFGFSQIWIRGVWIRIRDAWIRITLIWLH